MPRSNLRTTRLGRGHVRVPTATPSRPRLRRPPSDDRDEGAAESEGAAALASPRHRPTLWRMPETRAKQVGSKILAVPKVVTEPEPDALPVWPPASARAAMDRRRADGVVVEHVHRLAAACAAVAAGFDACGKHARSSLVAEAARAFAVTHRVLAEQVALFGFSLGAPSRRRAATSERLRWEWLASTAALLDGSPDLRLLAECTRLLRVAGEAAVVLELTLASHAPEAVRDIRQIHLLLDRARAGVAELEGRLTHRAPIRFS